ncbi:MAG TPA: hypothetical protein VKB46_00095, partial [Pyrinomonadaceae bacterium]|nr:hypothetical protein [Pyrinomonadaceae bacterium]
RTEQNFRHVGANLKMKRDGLALLRAGSAGDFRFLNFDFDWESVACGVLNRTYSTDTTYSTNTTYSTDTTYTRVTELELIENDQSKIKNQKSKITRGEPKWKPS